jgi:Antibiotic biosynthesis monooxygenase
VEQFLKAWEEDATKFKNETGFISAQLHKGIGKSTVFINYAVWESLKHFKNAVDNVMGPDPQSRLNKYSKRFPFLGFVVTNTSFRSLNNLEKLMPDHG